MDLDNIERKMMKLLFVGLIAVTCSLWVLPPVQASIEPSVSSESSSCVDVVESSLSTNPSWYKPKSQQTYSEFTVAGRNLAEYGFVEQSDHSSGKNESEGAFDLLEDFDISDQIKGNESLMELLAYRHTLKRQSLSFYVDKIARKRWLPSQGFDQPKQFFNAYKSELTTTQETSDEINAIMKQLENQTDYVAKSTHQSTGYGSWIVGYDSETGVARCSRRADVLDDETVTAEEIAAEAASGLAQSLNEEAPCFESWALFNVHPGLVVEERFTHVNCEDCPPDEFNLFTVWGRVWSAKLNVLGEDGYDSGWIHRNGTVGHGSHLHKYPEYVDFPRLVAMAETLGANKDMFRTDVFVGVPAGAVKKGATPEERAAAVKYAVSECEIYPTTVFDDNAAVATPREDEVG